MSADDTSPQPYEPSENLKTKLAEREAALKAEGTAHQAFRKGIANELDTDPTISHAELAEHLPWHVETVRLIAKEHGATKRQRRRAQDGPPRAYVPSDAYKALRAAWQRAVKAREEAVTATREAVAAELTANRHLSNDELAEHLPWSEEIVRQIAREYQVPRRYRRGDDHKVTKAAGEDRVVVPRSWYEKQKDIDTTILDR